MHTDSELFSLCPFSFMLRVCHRSSKYKFIIVGLTQKWLEPAIYRTRGEHALHHYITDSVYKECISKINSVVYAFFLLAIVFLTVPE